MIAIEDVLGEIAAPKDVDVTPQARPVQPAFDPIDVVCSQPEASTSKKTWSTGGFELALPLVNSKKSAGAATQKIVHPPLKKLRQANLSCSNLRKTVLPHPVRRSRACQAQRHHHLHFWRARRHPRRVSRASSSALVPKESRLAPSPSSVAEPPVFQPAPHQKTISTLSPEDRNAALLQSGCAVGL